MQKVIIDYSDNPELAAYVASKSPGDECEITFRMKFISGDGGKMEASVEEMEYEYEDEDVEIAPSEEEPIAMEVITVSDMEEESSEEGRETMGMESLMDDEEEEV